jgi:hypothetical protein
MAMAQITLSADEEAVKRAERAAAARNTTVTSMLTTALEAIGELDFDTSDLPPVTRAALGMASNIPNRPYKELLVEALSDKYGAGK